MKVLEAMEKGTMTGSEIEAKVKSLLADEMSARGFMAALSVNNNLDKFGDESLSALIAALKESGEVAYDLLVKNIIMSSSAALSHEERGENELKSNSQQVTENCLKLARKVDDERLNSKVDEVLQAIKAFQEDPENPHDSHHFWFTFFERWGYSDRHLEHSKPHLQALKTKK